jgi:phytoene dehydrogenase-like protein
MDFLAPRDQLPSLVTAYVEGGMEGLVSPWVQAIEARGGQVLLGLEPREVLFCRDRAAGLLAVDGSHLALELRARHVVLAEPLWRALPLLPPERIDPELAALAGALEDEQADAVGWVAGLSRLPRLRSNGEPEHHIGWNRVLVGDERRYLGGFHLPSLAVSGVAPDGKHLLHALVGRWLRRDERVDWETSRSAVDRILTHLRDFYLDLDACIEWHAHQAVSRPALLAWYWAPLLRHGIRAPGVGGVYLASATFESDAGPIDICAHAGLEAAHAILEDGNLAR